MMLIFGSSICVILLYLLCSLWGNVSSQHDEGNAEDFLDWYENVTSEYCYQSNLASWAFNTNITDANQAKMIEAGLRLSQHAKNAWENITKFDWQHFQNESVKRQFKLLSVLGLPALPKDKLEKLKNITSKMESIYSSTKICKYNDLRVCNISLEPEITKILEESRDYDELLHVWQQWHINVGRKCKSLYKPYVELSNEAARLNGKHDLGDLWRHPYEDDDFESDVAELWDQLRPFYLQLHAYVRRKLLEKYGAEHISATGPIPAHLLGNMWAQDWTNIFDFTKPFQNASSVSVDDEMKNQNYTVDRIFHLADDFYASLGLEKMPESLWNNSMFVKPNDGREVVCHASAWDFCNGKDFRIKMCTVVSLDNFVVVHHEMGHIEYYLQYKDQPITFREGANPGFHEAIGDLMALSASSRNHLHTLKLVHQDNTKEEDINYLFHKALEKLAFLPFGYLVDSWRWKVFRGDIPDSKWNEEWWKMRKDLQGIVPAIPRTPEDFDPASKYHIVADVPYDRYFVAAVIQFQFHKALCTIAGQYNATDPEKLLHHCDTYQNKEAGKRLSDALRLGASKHWPEVMEIITGQRKMNADAILEFYRPLIEFLKEENERTGEKIGWD